jgi:hypothetical protein
MRRQTALRTMHGLSISQAMLLRQAPAKGHTLTKVWLAVANIEGLLTEIEPSMHFSNPLTSAVRFLSVYTQHEIHSHYLAFQDKS